MEIRAEQTQKNENAPAVRQDSPTPITTPARKFAKKRIHIGGSAAPVAAAPPVVRQALPTSHLARLAGEEGWIRDGKSQHLSPKYLDLRRIVANNLLRFLVENKIEAVGSGELKLFLSYLGEENVEGGRWGLARLSGKVRPATARTYYNHLRILFGWIVEEGLLDVSPMASIKPPKGGSDQVAPFSAAHVDALLRAARASAHPARDEAVLLFLLNTGLRADELCNLKERDLDLTGLSVTVIGKGNKKRTVHFHPDTKRLLWKYRREEVTGERSDSTPLFLSERGSGAGQALTTSGLLQIFRRLGRTAKLTSTVRCSPHTCRHTFAVEFLRHGGDETALRMALGHSDYKMVQRYVKYAQADLERQQRRFSPVAWIKKAGAE